MRPALLALIISITSLSAEAYDFSVQNDDGSTIYYNICGSDAQVTFEKQFVPSESYSSCLKVPSSVTYNGITYSVTSIGRLAFFASPIESIMLPETISAIEDFAFAGCDHLLSVELPCNLLSLGKNVFDGCISLSDFKVANSNAAYRAISGVVYDKSGKSLIVYPQGREDEGIISPATETVADEAFYGCIFMSHVSIPDGVKSIGNNSFYFCNGLSSISLPASITSIGKAAFADCINLNEINVDVNNPSFMTVNGSLLNKDGNILLSSPAAKVGSAAIPESVKNIYDLSFFRNIGVTTAIIPDGIVEIGDGAFTDCQSLTAVSLPATLQKIGSLAFAMCGSLNTVYVRHSDPSALTLSPDVFTGINPDKCTLYVPYGSMDAYRAAEGWSEFDNIVEYDALIPQQIEWNTEYKLIGDESVTITLDAEASSGLPVTYVLSPESIPFATINGNKLTMLTDTEIMVTATQNGNSSFAPADAVTRTIKAIDAIDSTVADSAPRVFSESGNIIILDADTHSIAHVYDVEGHTVYSGTSRKIRVAPGRIYIVNIDKYAFKVPVR